MAPKRPHSKSRFGCDNCKKRRVKCDEITPACANCDARNETCIYSTPPRRVRPNQRLCSSCELNIVDYESPASSSETTTQDVATNRLHFHTLNRRKEIELMQFWFTKTCFSFTTRVAELFRGHATALALDHEYLADSIFALTALHKASETADPTIAASYVSIALQYQNNTIASFRTALHDMTETNCDAIFIYSIITLVCSVVSPFLPAGNNDNTPRSAIDNVLLLNKFLSGITSILTVSRQWVSQGPCKVLFRSNGQLVGSPPGDRGEIFLLPIMQLQKMNDEMNSESKSLHGVYAEAIKQLERCTMEDRIWTVAWLTLSGRDFVNELEKHEGFALVILLHWGVLLDKLDDMWWAKYSGKRLVKEISEDLEKCEGSWNEVVAWARKEVGLKIDYYL